jgi:hypothetical protein
MIAYKNLNTVLTVELTEFPLQYSRMSVVEVSINCAIITHKNKIKIFYT